MVAKTPVNPWSWQDARGFTQAWRVEGATTIVYVSGQVALDADGNLVGAGDFEAQARQTFDNIGQVLAKAGASFDDIVKLNVYLTDTANLPALGRIKAGYIKGQQPASTAVGVTALAMPGLLLEVEATAVL